MARETNEITYEVTYKGGLTTSSDVYMHYGYANWSDVSEKKMRKLKTSYKAEITLPTNSELNFCFRDGSNNWDNNYGNDYYFTPSSDWNYSLVDICAKTTNTTKKTGTAAKAKTTASCARTGASRTTKTTTSAKTKTASKSKK